METINSVEKETSQVMIEDAREAVNAICKNSRLRMHYFTLIVTNNVMRAFITNYELEPRFKEVQESFLEILKTMEARKNRTLMTSEKIGLQDALRTFEEILESTTDDQLREMLLFVDSQRSEAKWVVTERKSIKSSRA